MVSEEDNLDYSLESIFSVSSEKAKQPEIISVLVMEVEPTEMLCVKGDCNQDYAPG
jgi:hypothetical protein